MNVLQDCINYVRRIIKSPSNQTVSDSLLVDYINRFWLMDMDARMQLFDLKTKYTFQTSPGVDQYNMPLYGVNGYPNQGTVGGLQSQISYYPVYQGFFGPAYINGIEVPFLTERQQFFRNWPNYVQLLQSVAIGDGSTSTFTLPINYSPILRGHIDINGIMNQGQGSFASLNDPIYGSSYNDNVPKTSVYPAVTITTQAANGLTLVVTDSGQFDDNNVNSGFLYGATSGSSRTVNVVNYNTGAINVTFSTPPAAQAPINVEVYFVQQGIPTQVLFYNNIITLRTVPNTSYQVELDAYLSPAAFLSTGQAIQFAYMTEYLARGAARKYLSDVGDTEQFMFYEPLFQEQELLVWKRSQRIFTSTRTNTIYSSPSNQSASGMSSQGV